MSEMCRQTKEGGVGRTPDKGPKDHKRPSTALKWAVLVLVLANLSPKIRQIVGTKTDPSIGALHVFLHYDEPPSTIRLYLSY